MANTTDKVKIERLVEILKSKARRLTTHAIVESSKTDDLIYHDKLHDLSLKIYEALISDDLQHLLDLTNELESIMKPKRHYGALIEGIEST